MFFVPFFRPDITEQEIAAVSDVLRSGWLTTGPVTKRFEVALADYIGVSKVAALNAQTNATFCTMRLLGIGPGDEVIVPAYTYSASCSIIYHVGATPVMIDCAKDSFEMNYDLMEEAINERTKAIIPVDLGGVVCDYDRILEAVDRKRHLFKPVGSVQESLGRVAVVADTAHSLGASRNGIMAGAIADFSNFSFHSVKNLTTAEGGAASWRTPEGFDDDDLYEQYMLLSLHGQTKDAFAKNEPGSWEYDIVEPYYKCNLTDVSSAIGLSQLGRYQSMLMRRKEIVEYYYDRFRKFNVSWLEHFNENTVSSLHLFLLRLNGKDVHERNMFIAEAAKLGVSLNVHYKPLPMLSAYRKRGFQIEDFPEAYAQYENEVTLPLFSSMTDVEVEYVVDTLVSLLKHD
ncbi:MAG: DegT/DnrJ/EryC1/StrS family aminotransferase [Saccharofermentanales bacterium]